MLNIGNSLFNHISQFPVKCRSQDDDDVPSLSPASYLFSIMHSYALHTCNSYIILLSNSSVITGLSFSTDNKIERLARCYTPSPASVSDFLADVIDFNNTGPNEGIDRLTVLQMFINSCHATITIIRLHCGVDMLLYESQRSSHREHSDREQQQHADKWCLHDFLKTGKKNLIALT